MTQQPKYILGFKGLSKFFGISPQDIDYLIRNNGIPGIRKLRRRSDSNFTGGGRGVWALNRKLAEQYRHTRQNTPQYDPRIAVKLLVNKYEGSGCTNIPELIKAGLITDLDWCVALSKVRAESNMHVPILMNPEDLYDWMGKKRRAFTKAEAYPETTEIFKKVRNAKAV